mgnify:CR=1 FL=1
MSKEIDNPLLNDNRDYQYNDEYYNRHEFSVIKNWIPKNSKIIDLGCGNGALMSYLKKENIDVEGIEIAKSGVEVCLKNGLKVIRGAIDEKATYQIYSDYQFDYSICNVTIQMVKYPEILINEMKRISKYQIISFPNFAYLENRLDLLFNGVMPRKMLYKYKWYNTGHIHQLSLRDFKNFCRENKLQIIKRQDFGCFSFISRWFWPNLFSKESIFLCKKYDL